MNPNSAYHLALRLNYPNAYDRELARHERRTNLGGDIMIHGSNLSVGCLAMGDMAAEDLFGMAADTGINNIEVITEETMAAETDIYIFKVALDRERSIWRRIAIRGEQTLDDLHWAIFRAFDRDDEHLYAFYIGTPIGKQTRGQFFRHAIRYLHPRAIDCYLERIGEEKDAETSTIASLPLVVRQGFYYLFDFGAEWWHFITVEKLHTEPDPKLQYPAVIEQHGESPEQYPRYGEEEEE